MPDDTLSNAPRTHIYTLSNGATLSITGVPAKTDASDPDFQAYALAVARRLSVAGLAFKARQPGPEVREVVDYSELEALLEDS